MADTDDPKDTQEQAREPYRRPPAQPCRRRHCDDDEDDEEDAAYRDGEAAGMPWYWPY